MKKENEQFFRHEKIIRVFPKLFESYYHIIISYHTYIYDISKSKVIPPLAQHLYYIAYEIPVSNRKLLKLNLFRQLSEIKKILRDIPVSNKNYFN